ncbi:MAG: hypothetical protein H0W25_04745 [Acidimicrobiia bacterium]|nr:hypothetical protein [Acidimicrobiia bacterium]MBA3575450.1 hypothetical protein [Pseudonocardiales bacterium]
MTKGSVRNETPPEGKACAAPGCTTPIVPLPTGRLARFCSDACRGRAHRHRHTPVPTTAEADMGSASSRGRHPDRAWLVRLRRGHRTVIVAMGLRQPAADRLVEQINDLLADPA